MRKTSNAAIVGGVTMALVGVLVLVVGAGSAEANGSPKAPQGPTRLIAAGAGYASPGGSAAVRALQRRLHRAGEDPGPADGLYGPLTQAAVERFQAQHGLAIDGVVGPRTTAALRRAPVVIGPGSGYGEPHGSARVRALQRQLRSAGEDPGPIDGLYGPLTQAAVEHFQVRKGLTVDGTVGKATRGTLVRFATSAPERRSAGQGQAGSTPRIVQAAKLGPTPGNQPGPARTRAHPKPKPMDFGSGLPAWFVALAIAMAVAFAVGAVALLRAQAARRRSPTTGMLGYVSDSGHAGSAAEWELELQAQVVAGECTRRGFELLDLVHDREPPDGRAIGRPGLGDAFRRISSGEARGLVVSELARMTRSAAELGMILEWFMRSEARLVAVAERFDTDDPEGRLTARALAEIASWEVPRAGHIRARVTHHT